MPTKHEAIILALLTRIKAASSSNVMREESLPVQCPPNGIVNVRPEDPEELDQMLGVGIKEWSRVVQLEIVVQGKTGPERAAALDERLAELGSALFEEHLGGLVDHIELSAPEEADEIPMHGAAGLRGVIMPLTAIYETGNNPMELI